MLLNKIIRALLLSHLIETILQLMEIGVSGAIMVLVARVVIRAKKSREDGVTIHSQLMEGMSASEKIAIHYHATISAAQVASFKILFKFSNIYFEMLKVAFCHTIF